VAKVLGVGGVFFKAQDPDALGGWYARWLKAPVRRAEGASFNPADMPRASFVVWAPFTSSTTYFEPSTQPFMINFVVDDLDGALAQVRSGGATVIGEIEQHDYGRFGWFLDPEGNKVELWQPPVASHA
jgi:catechol 2,3-dioxygenase-like lactoylglutathione lyase family enzyme